MTIWTILFWISLVVLFYCYLGYGILVFLFTALKKSSRAAISANIEPAWPVTLIVTAYNEETILLQKIQNTLAIDYPANMLQIIFITDGSTDGSVEIVEQFTAINSLYQPERKGKYAAIKRAMKHARHSIVVFSDANTMLNPACIRKIVAHYQYPKTGGVAGEKKISRSKSISAIGEAEGLYWQYESLLKKLDARFNTVTGAAGELFSMRSSLFKELSDELVLDDFVMSMQVCLQGYKIDYEPGAFAVEMPSATLAEEEKRKIRISAGAYQSIGYLKECLNFFKHPLLSFQYVSRRLLRWVFCPVLLLLLAVSNILLTGYYTTAPFYNWMLYAQILFYGIAIVGWAMAASDRKPGLFTIPFYFVFMNYCLVKGFFKFIKGKQTVLWEKSLRKAVE